MANFSTGDRMRKPKGDRLDQFSFEMFYKTLSLEFFFFFFWGYTQRMIPSGMELGSNFRTIGYERLLLFLCYLICAYCCCLYLLFGLTGKIF